VLLCMLEAVEAELRLMEMLEVLDVRDPPSVRLIIVGTTLTLAGSVLGLTR